MVDTPIIKDCACKHGISRSEIEYAFRNISEYRRAKANKQPPHYLAVSTLPNGNSVELVMFSTGLQWCVFHAQSPIQPGFKKQWKEAGK